MSPETALLFWVIIAVVLALAHLVNSYQWYRVIVKILRLKERIQELEIENEELRKEK